MTWTTESLLTHIEALLRERDKRFDAQLGAIEQHLIAAIGQLNILADRVRALEQVTTAETQVDAAQRNGTLMFIAAAGLVVSAVSVTASIIVVIFGH